MAERKVLNKYYPPSFDPTRIPRLKVPKDVQHRVRLMTPFSMRCSTCGEYIYKGKKFNASKETVQGEEYLGIRIFRFYIRCPRCSAEITFKTDPENTDYVAELGAVRNFEPWREDVEVAESVKRQRLADEALNPIKALENKTVDSKYEIDALETLDEIRTLNARHERVTADAALEHKKNQNLTTRELEDAMQAAEDEMLVKAAFSSTVEVDGDGYIHRLSDSEEIETNLNLPKARPIISIEKSTTYKSLTGLVRRKQAPSVTSQVAAKAKPSLVVNYSSDDENEN